MFQLLTGTRPDPGKIHAGQVGVATLSDPRLDYLAALHKPKKVTPATVEFLDTPGLMPGSHADNPQRLALIREGDALLVVLNGFRGGDPAAELTAFRDEMLFADLSVVTSRVERLEASLKKPRPDREQLAKELEIVKPVQAVLEEGKTVASLGLSADDKKPLRSFGLLTDKPQVVVLEHAPGTRAPGLALGARAGGPGDRRQARARALAARSRGTRRLHGRPGRHRAGPRSDHPQAYDAVGIITFFTAGEPEVRGWNLERGATAVEAAGKIHTDLAKGFIRAEVTAYDDLKRRRLAQGSQGQASPTARRQGIHRQGRRRHLLPQRGITPAEAWL